MNTKVTFLYRDACNYKTASEAIFAGEPTDELRQRFFAALNDGEYLVPVQVGVDHPASGSYMDNGRFPDEEDDHGWVEVGERDVEPTEHEEPTDERTFERFVVACEAANEKGWDPMTTINAAGGWSDPDLAAQLRGSVDE